MCYKLLVDKIVCGIPSFEISCNRLQKWGILLVVLAFLTPSFSDVGAEPIPENREDSSQPLAVVRKPIPLRKKRPYEPKAPQAMPFHVFNNAIFPPVKNFALSGYMGDASDVKISGSYKVIHQEGYPTLKVGYTGAGLQGWAGVMWQNPANNWGEFDGGYNLTQATRLTFWARGKEGGEIVEFKIGGTAANYPDSDNLSTGDITLTRDWTQYAIDLSQAELVYISAGFGFVLKQDMNPQGCTFFMDDIKYEM